MPRGLFSPLVVLLLVLIIGAELGFVAMFRQLVQQPRMERLIDMTRTQVETLQAALTMMAPEQRSTYLARLAELDRDKLALHRMMPHGVAPAPLVLPAHPLIMQFIAGLRQRLGPGYAVEWQESHHQRVWVGTAIGEQDYWYGIDASAFVPTYGALVVAFMLASCLLAVVVTYLIRRRINRPLAALAAAADWLARGKVSPLRVERMPSEMAQVSASFNQMASALDTAERERALMLAGVSHDLRTPLAKLRLAVEILAENGEADIIAGMVRNIASADAIIGQFIDFARVGSDEPVQLTDINALLVDVAIAADPSRVRLKLGDLPLQACRSQALSRALTNLLENALRYGRRPDGTPAAIVLRSYVTGGTIALSVSDDGVGIPPDHIARLRRPFTRLDTSRSGASGSGLGLAIVERIVRLHNGRLKLVNRAGGGLNATLMIPMDPPPRPTAVQTVLGHLRS